MQAQVKSRMQINTKHTRIRYLAHILLITHTDCAMNFPANSIRSILFMANSESNASILETYLSNYLLF